MYEMLIYSSIATQEYRSVYLSSAVAVLGKGYSLVEYWKMLSWFLFAI